VSRVPDEEWVRTEVPISLILLMKCSIMHIYMNIEITVLELTTKQC